MRRAQARHELAKDILYVFIGAVIALFLSKDGIIDGLIALLGNAEVASFTAGIFFTSVFTIAPSSVALGHIAQEASVHTVALWGALGAVCGDLILFFFIRDRFAGDLLNSLKPSVMRHILASFHLGFLKWLSPILGALIIASPLPDEFGLMLLGMSKVRTVVLIPISFAMNMLGIYTIVWFAQAF